MRPRLPSSITSAIVTIQSGSLANRLGGTGSGFGIAPVSADNGFGSISLGLFLSTSTGGNASSVEESVKDSVFDVLPVLVSQTGTLRIIIDGAGLVDPIDQFALDLARLDIQGTPRTTPTVPEPSSLILIGTGMMGALSLRRR